MNLNNVALGLLGTATATMLVMLWAAESQMQDRLKVLEETRVEVTQDEILVCKHITQRIYHCSPIVVEVRK